jgi:hypothetical protein
MREPKTVMEVIVYVPDYRFSTVHLFVSEDAFLNWWKSFYVAENLKHLRVKWQYGKGTVYNWNSLQSPYGSSVTWQKVYA